MSRDQLQEMGIESVQNILDALPSAPANRVLLDGVQFPLVDQRLPLDLVEGVEIIRGGVSPLYGSAGFGNLINITTADSFRGVEIGGSLVFSDLYRQVADYWVTTEHSSECDATDAAGRPFESLSPSHDWGGPIKKDNVWYFGSQLRGFPKAEYNFREFGSPTAVTPSTPATEPSTSLDFGSGWTLDIQFLQTAPGADGAISQIPAQNVFFCIETARHGAEYGVPGSPGAIRDTETGAGASPHTRVSDAMGRVSIPLDGFGFSYVPSQVQLEVGFAESAEAAEAVDAFELGAKLDWQLGVNWERKQIGVRTTLEEPLGIVAQFAGRAGDLGDLASFPYRDYLKDRFDVGANQYQSYSFLESYKVDVSKFQSMQGFTGLEEDTCGQEELPADGQGYVSQAVSPVQSVEDQWALERVGLTDAVALQAASGGGAPIVVGVIDTGLDWNHLDFAWENLWRNEDEVPANGIDDDGNGYVDDVIGWNFVSRDNKPWDDDGHGTFVAGLIGATRGNGLGIDGINANARVMVLKALNRFGRTRASYVAQAIVYGVDNGARILNVSVGSREVPQVVIDALAYAQRKGVLVVAAAGNRAETVGGGAPGGAGVLAVAATGPDDRRAPFSNVGPAVRIAAPGVDVVSLRGRRTDFMLNSATTTYPAGDAYLGEDRRYYRSAGTSFAAPIVSGIASLVWSQRPELTARQVQRMLEQSARDVETPGVDLFTGYGLVDAQAALAADPEFFVDARIEGVRRVEDNGQVLVEVLGAANADQFGRAWLEVGRGEDPTSWVVVGQEALSAPVRGGALGRIQPSRFDGAQVWTVRLLTEHLNGRLREARYVIELAGASS